MKNKQSKTILFSICLLVGMLFGCHSSKRAVVKAPIKEYGADFLLEKMNENQFQFETISMKASIAATLNGSKSPVDLTGTVRMIRDSIIWVSVSPGLGIEIARFYITQDSVQYMDRVSNQYFTSDFSFFNANYQVDLDFNMLQSLFLGNDFNYYEYTKFKAAYDGGNYRLTAQGRQKQKKYIRNSEDARRILIQNTWLNPDNFKIEAMQIKAIENQNRKLQTNYSNFIKVDGQLFPSKEIFELTMQEEGKSNYKSSISITFSKIEINKEISAPFSIPDKYTKMR